MVLEAAAEDALSGTVKGRSYRILGQGFDGLAIEMESDGGMPVSI